MFVNILIAVLVIIQLLGMIWAWRKTSEADQRGLWRLFLTVAWPLTWLLSLMVVQ